MKRVLKILLWVVWLSSATVGMQMLGFALFGPAMMSPDAAQELSERVLIAQLMAAGGGRGRIFAIGAACILICIVCRKALRHIRQSENDAEARLVLSQVRDEKRPARPYFLYLRAFETTRRLKAPLFLLDLLTLGLSQLRTRELESFLSESLRKTGTLIALGHPGENFGAGRVTTSNKVWMSDIARLAHGAYGILLIPSHRPGTLWEIEHLEREGLLSRTIFVMPPESRRFNWRSHWAQARRAMGQLGAALPEYENLGMLFTLGPDHAVRSVEPFSLFSNSSLRKSILKLLNQRTTQQVVTDLDVAIRKARHRAGRWRLFGLVNLLTRAGAYAFLAVLLVLGEKAATPQAERPTWSAVWNGMLKAASIEEGEQSIAAEFSNSDAYQQAVRSLSAAQKIHLSGEVIEAGFRRLSDAQLASLYAAVSDLLERSDLPTCGAIARDNTTTDQFNWALLKLDPNVLTNWWDMYREAAKAELSERPFPSVSYSSLVEAKRRFEQSLTPDDLKRFNALSRRGVAHTLEEDCWLARKSYGAVKSLPEPDKLQWARLIEFQHETPGTLRLVTNPLEKLKTLPAFQQRTQGMSEKQVDDFFGELVGKGVERLDDSTLLARYAAMANVLEKADEVTCEAIASGAASTEQFETALGRIAESSQTAFLDSQYRAAVAELQQLKPSVLTKEEKEVVSEKFLSIFSKEEMARLQMNKASQDPAARERSCWIARKDFGAVTLLEEPYDRMWARNLAQP
jgi:hypothetical protein